MTLEDMRARYRNAELLEADVPDPVELLRRWVNEAIAASVVEPNAMILSTVTSTGQPRARAVLLRGLDQRGLTFYTNYDSDKGHELSARPQACVTFLWTEVARQVRVEGDVAKITAAESDAYFASRPRGHQIGAWASEQSRVVASRDVLEARMNELEQRFGHDPVPRPPHWGGFRLTPRMWEFWQGRDNRLHDRLRFAGGKLERLNP